MGGGRRSAGQERGKGKVPAAGHGSRWAPARLESCRGLLPNEVSAFDFSFPMSKQQREHWAKIEEKQTTRKTDVSSLL